MKWGYPGGQVVLSGCESLICRAWSQECQKSLFSAVGPN